MHMDIYIYIHICTCTYIYTYIHIRAVYCGPHLFLKFCEKHRRCEADEADRQTTSIHTYLYITIQTECAWVRKCVESIKEARRTNDKSWALSLYPWMCLSGPLAFYVFQFFSFLKFVLVPFRAKNLENVRFEFNTFEYFEAWKYSSWYFCNNTHGFSNTFKLGQLTNLKDIAQHLIFTMEIK